jgi:hypothetical protein
MSRNALASLSVYQVRPVQYSAPTRAKHLTIER